MKLLYSFLAFFFSISLQAAEEVRIQTACFATVCPKESGISCKEVSGQKRQRVTISLHDPGGWPQRFFGKADCKMEAAGVDLSYSVRVILEGHGRTYDFIPVLTSSYRGSVKESRPGSFFAKDLRKISYMVYYGEKVDQGDFFVFPGLVIDSEEGTFGNEALPTAQAPAIADFTRQLRWAK